jgi:sigma-B regulation protein RsbU (phosphoserine phosphatase)
MGLIQLAPDIRADTWTADLEESLGRVAMLGAAVLGAPSASVTPADAGGLPGRGATTGNGHQRSLFEQSLCTQVVRSADKVIIGDTRLDGYPSNGNGDLLRPASVIAWAGVPVRDQDGHVAGVLWVADRKPRRWNATEIAILESLADVASSDVILRAALARTAGRAALAETLEESLLPPRLPPIPGLDVAARYATAGTGTEVLADFCDLFPSANGAVGNGGRRRVR